MSEEAVVARKGPYGVVVEKGKTYNWCACGLSKSQPFCDGSHQGTEFEPVRFVAEDKVMVAFCGCKQSRYKPFCDDSHIAIVEEPKDDDESIQGERII
ncbi:MAG: CDGSH iron-sulfur domain-containing protein [Gammaproteobacteria bacterium]|nr:CDGSH iron-sulfur domain-containing protein [Gammaproteobacteria bacterium]NNJ50594.1 CDGSH iron-sulfur domain-containing protein [Gammaproteobacteria bacterium]